jgi:hypothetical protein
MLKKVLNRKQHGRWPVGRPRQRWEDNMRRDSLLLLNIRGWKRLAGDNDIWGRFVEEVRERCGQSCHGIIKRRRLPNCLS